MADDVNEYVKHLVNQFTPTGMAEGLKKIDPKPMWEALQAYFGIGQVPQPPRRPDFAPNAPENVRRQQLEQIRNLVAPQAIAPQAMPVEMQMPQGMPIPPNALDLLREQGPAYRGNPRKK
jgi:hypothetical protein